MKIDKINAAYVFREEARKADVGSGDPQWEEKIEKLSRLCEEGEAKTHIAFLATVMLAKTLDMRADVYAIKPRHAQDNPNAFSARSLCHGVIVPLAAELGINLGVTGREPLNNQPYFRMQRLGDGTAVHDRARKAFNYMFDLVQQIHGMTDETEVQKALRAFIAVRRRYQPRYPDHEDNGAIKPDRLVTAIQDFVRENSENGRRAQAVVAGLMDVFAGADRVESGRINDPSRRHPGDVCIRSASDPEELEKAVEVRDKPVNASDVQIFGRKCVDMGVREAAVVMVSDHQETVPVASLTEWANGLGIGLTLFHGWPAIVDQALYWSALPKPVAACRALSRVHHRLVAVEVSEEGMRSWETRTQQ